jgi:hypothetical protein
MCVLVSTILDLRHPMRFNRLEGLWGTQIENRDDHVGICISNYRTLVMGFLNSTIHFLPGSVPYLDAIHITLVHLVDV